MVSSTPPPRFKASGVGRAPRARARLFLLASPQLQRSPFSAVAHASSAQGINETAVECGRALRGGKKKQPTSHAWHTGGADPAGAPGEGSESGVQFSQLPEKGRKSDLGQRPGGGIQGSVTIAWFSSSNCLFLE